MGTSAQFDVSTQNPALDFTGVTAAKIAITTFFSPMAITLNNLSPGTVMFCQFQNNSGADIVLSLSATDTQGAAATVEFITANNQLIEFSKGHTATVANGGFHTFIGALFESVSQPPLVAFQLI